MDTIKSGRKVFELRPGEDIIMDNGYTYQLLTREIFQNWSRYPAPISKAQFKLFMKLDITEIKKHPYSESARLYRYEGPAKQ